MTNLETKGQQCLNTYALQNCWLMEGTELWATLPSGVQV